MIYICGVHLGLLPLTSLGSLRLKVILVFSVFISTYSGKALATRWPRSLSLSLSIPLPLCLRIQFLEDMCTSFVWCACMFNSWRICAQFYILTLLSWCVFCACIFDSCWLCAHVALVFGPTRESQVRNPIKVMKDLLLSVICLEVLVIHGGAPLVYSLLGMVTCWEVCWQLWPTRKFLHNS